MAGNYCSNQKVNVAHTSNVDNKKFGLVAITGGSEASLSSTEADGRRSVILGSIVTDLGRLARVSSFRETIVRWHRQGFRYYWRWKSRRRGRPRIDTEIQHLIRRMCRANPLWGAPRIHGQLFCATCKQCTEYIQYTLISKLSSL